MRFGFESKKNTVDLDLAPNLFTPGIVIGFDLPIVQLTYIGCVGIESEFGFKAVGFGFGLKKK